MGLFNSIKGPVLLKKGYTAKEHLSAMEALLAETTHKKVITTLESDIANMKAGIFGEEVLLFELRNSHIPMCVLHDLYLEHEGLGAQIDFLIVTRKRIFVVECKNLYGNITVNAAGDFVRVIGSRKEGIYSPVTQSRRHLELLKQIRGGDITMMRWIFFEKALEDNYRSVVVLANPKTVLNARYAPKEIRQQVIRADQLSEHIRKVNGERDALDRGEKVMVDVAEYFLGKNVAGTEAGTGARTDYMEKYRRMMEEDMGETGVRVGVGGGGTRGGRTRDGNVRSEENVNAESRYAKSAMDKNAGTVNEAGKDYSDALAQRRLNELRESMKAKKETVCVEGSQQDASGNRMTEEAPPPCPVCGHVMVRRMAVKGANAGKDFWGCPQFPKCRGVVKIE